MSILRLFCRSSQRDTWNCLIYAKLITVFNPNLRIFLLFRSHAWKYNIQANKRLTKVKKENDNYSIWYFWSLFHFFHCNGPDNKCYKQVRRAIFCTHQTSGACAIARIRWKKRLIHAQIAQNNKFAITLQYLSKRWMKVLHTVKHQSFLQVASISICTQCNKLRKSLQYLKSD